MDTKTILIIDGDMECLLSLSDILNRMGYNVISRQDGPSALSLIKEGAPVDLVITEYRIEGMDGLEFLALLKEIAPAVPSIMLTTYSSAETCLRAFNLGVSEYLNKPVRVKEMDRIVRSILDSEAAYEDHTAHRQGT